MQFYHRPDRKNNVDTLLGDLLKSLFIISLWLEQFGGHRLTDEQT
jgi:hypothetical protein